MGLRELKAVCRNPKGTRSSPRSFCMSMKTSPFPMTAALFGLHHVVSQPQLAQAGLGFVNSLRTKTAVGFDFE